MSRMTGMRFSVNERLSPLPDHLWNPPNLASAGHQEFLQSECEPDNSSPFNINVKNVLSFTSTPLHAWLAWCFIRKAKIYPLKVGFRVRLLTAFMLGLHLDPEDGDSTFLQNVGMPPPDYTAPRLRRQYSSRILSLVASSIDNRSIFTISWKFPFSFYFERESWKITMSLWIAYF